jgi:hypothetical protein
MLLDSMISFSFDELTAKSVKRNIDRSDMFRDLKTTLIVSEMTSLADIDHFASLENGE